MESPTFEKGQQVEIIVGRGMDGYRYEKGYISNFTVTGIKYVPIITLSNTREEVTYDADKLLGLIKQAKDERAEAERAAAEQAAAERATAERAAADRAAAERAAPERAAAERAAAERAAAIAAVTKARKLYSDKPAVNADLLIVGDVTASKICDRTNGKQVQQITSNPTGGVSSIAGKYTDNTHFYYKIPNDFVQCDMSIAVTPATGGGAAVGGAGGGGKRKSRRTNRRSLKSRR